MKAYIATKKVDGRVKNGLTIYSESGDLLYSSVKTVAISENKFENALEAINWGVKKIKTLTSTKVLDDEEDIIIVIGSKTVYTWFEKEVAPEPYTILLGDIFLEMSFMFNQVELIHSKSGDKRVLYRNTSDEKVHKVSDLFKVE